MRSIILLLFVLQLHTHALAQPEIRFFNALIANETKSLAFDPNELNIAKRLGITFTAAPVKSLIGFDLDDSAKAKLRSGEQQFTTSLEKLEDGFSKLTVQTSAGLKKYYFFKHGKFVTPPFYFARNWNRIVSKHFEFWISDTTLFHPNAVRALEQFFDESAALLQLSATERARVAKNKIIYIYCHDEDEIEKLTGYKTRGIYLMSHDYVVTTYSCHYHEILHLLINYKCKTPPLFTHPMLQEGFAVAFGGRGGIALNSLLQSGVFLHDSKFLHYKELLSAKESLQQDASVTYPVHGLYARFLFQSLGLETFLALYKKYRTTSAGLNNLVIAEADLPAEHLWEQFCDSIRSQRDIVFSGEPQTERLIAQDSLMRISEGREFIHVQMRKNFTLSPNERRGSYASKKFREALPQQEYRGERYLFMADTNDVTIYDLHLNTSVASFSSGFTFPPEKVKRADGWCEFWVRKNVFTSPLRTMRVRHF